MATTLQTLFDHVEDVSKRASKVTENLLLEQLNDLISRDLLEVQVGPMTLVRATDSALVEMKQSVKLVLKDKQYIEKLENENKKLKDKLASINNAIKGTNE